MKTLSCYTCITTMATTYLTGLTLVVIVQILVSVDAQSASDTYITIPEVPATGGGILGRSNALGCARVCSQDASCTGYYLADNSSDSCEIYTDDNSNADGGAGTYFWKVSPAETPRSCAEKATQLGTALPYGQYQIDPDGQGGLDPITVTCNTSNDGNTWTHADHDRLSTETVYGSNSAWEVEYGYKHTITYTDPVSQLNTLASLSTSCRISVHIRCYKVLFEDTSGRDLAGWVAYDGTVFPMTEGGDVCPMNAASVRKCNCNNDAVWYTDTGYITNKDHFPIKSLAFGDMGPGSETLEITIGPLECTGLAECGSPPDIPFATKSVRGQAVGFVVDYYCFPGLDFSPGINWMVLACLPDGTWDIPLYTACQNPDLTGV